MMRILVTALIAVLAFTSGTQASPLLGPKGRFSVMIMRLEYDPSTACYKPRRPYGDDEYAWNSYRSEAREYVSCLKEAADSDIDHATRVVAEGYQKAVDDYLQELRRGY